MSADEKAKLRAEHDNPDDEVVAHIYLGDEIDEDAYGKKRKRKHSDDVDLDEPGKKRV